MKPPVSTVWLLDVDGVLNARRPGWGGPPRHGHATDGYHQYRLGWAPALISKIRALAGTDLVDIRWCTTWCAHASELERLWQLPRLSRAFTEPLNGHAASEAKLAAAREVLAAGRRLIWTDDMEVPEPWDDLYDELTADGRALLIRPDERCGLQPEHMNAIEEFLAAKVPDALG